MKKKFDIKELNFKDLDKQFLAVLIGVPLLLIISAAMLLLGAASTTIFATLSFGVILIALPYFTIGYLQFQDIKKAEDSYPNFLRDLTQAVNSGMTIPQAIKTISETDYGTLSKYISRLNAWLGWDVPFPKAWQNFTNLLRKSEVIQRINGIILESFQAGGDIGAILLSLSEDVDTIKKMEAEKRATFLQHLGVMYVVFFVFIGIIVTLHQILLPILFLQRFGVFSGISFRTAEVLDIDYFKNLFLLMTVVQAICLGAIAGQILEEKLIAGFKHAIIMLSIGVAVFFLLILPTKLTFEVEVTPQSVGIDQTFTVAGRIFFDEQPAGGAKVDILGPGESDLTTLFTDSLGQFTTSLKAPLQAGVYPITVIMTFESESRTEIVSLIVS